MEDELDETKQTASPTGTVIPLFGRDEMNLIEFPLGPITKTSSKTLEVNHPVWDRKRKREVNRSLLVTGSDAFGLPRPIDDQVLVGMQALTQEAAYRSPKVHFSQYRLCQILGWNPDGRAYARLEASFDRLAATTLKFKNSWWDKGEKSWRSHTFHLIDNVELCSQDRYSKFVSGSGAKTQSLNYFIWNEVLWKSFQDGFIRKLDLKMFRRVGRGRRREVALRLYRWLEKQFWHGNAVTICVTKLGGGTLGIAAKYPSEFARTIERAGTVLIECGVIEGYAFGKSRRDAGVEVTFTKKLKARKTKSEKRVIFREDAAPPQTSNEVEEAMGWLASRSEEELYRAETEALESGFGSKLERTKVVSERKSDLAIKSSGRIRRDYVRKFLEPAYREHLATLIAAA